jgi:hypothetical protein
MERKLKYSGHKGLARRIVRRSGITDGLTRCVLQITLGSWRVLTLLANTIEGYFADPAYGGNRDTVSWRMIGFPGAYAAYLGVYTHHGIRYDRGPLSMAHSHAHP